MSDGCVTRKVAENTDLGEFCIAFFITKKITLVDGNLEGLQKIHVKSFFLNWFSGT